MTTGITGRVIDKDFVLLIHDSTIAENDIGYIAYTLVVIRCDKMSAWLSDNFSWIS
ncbi:hypothetical protein D3C75_1178640 [compost metagenome]